MPTRTSSIEPSGASPLGMCNRRYAAVLPSGPRARFQPMPRTALLSAIPTTSLTVALAMLSCADVRAQSYLRGFGELVFDTELGPFATWTDVSVGGEHMVARRTNGEVVAWG